MRIPFILLLTIFSQITLCQGIKSEIQLNEYAKLIGIAKIFNVSEHKIDTCDTGLGWLTICRIDGNPWFGCDAGLDLPKYELSSLILEIENRSIELNVSQMYEPAYMGILQKDHFRISKTKDGLILDGHFSDGAGTYRAQWKIRNGNSKRTLLTKEESEF